jgi:hypothetical protein
MEAVSGLFTAMGPATVEAGLAAGGTAGAGGWVTSTAAATPLSQTMSMLQGGMTQGRMLSEMISGVGAFSTGHRNAMLSEAQGSAEKLASEERALRIQKEMAQKIGASRVAFAASGVDINSGTAAAVTSNLESDGKFELGLEAANANSRSIMSKMRSDGFKSQGDFGLLGGFAKAAATGASGTLDIAKRG